MLVHVMYFTYVSVRLRSSLFIGIENFEKVNLVTELHLKLQYSRCLIKNIMMLLSQLELGGIPGLLFQIDTAYLQRIY